MLKKVVLHLVCNVCCSCLKMYIFLLANNNIYKYLRSTGVRWYYFLGVHPWLELYCGFIAPHSLAYSLLDELDGTGLRSKNSTDHRMKVDSDRNIFLRYQSSLEGNSLLSFNNSFIFCLFSFV